MRHTWMRVLVPREWSPSQALLAVNLLRQAIDAVWAVHGEDMAAELLEEEPYRDHLGEYVDIDDPTDPDDMGDLPF